MADEGTKTVEELAKDLSEVVTESRALNEETKGKLKGLDVEKMAKMMGDIETISKSISDAEVKSTGEIKAANQQIETLEKQFAVIAASGGDKTKVEGKTAAQKAFGEFLRTTKGGESYEAKLPDIVAEIIAKDYSSDLNAEMIAKDLLVGNDGQGGFLAPTEFGGIIQGRIFESSPVRSVANVVTMSGSEISFVLDDDEPDAGWVGEVSARGETTTPGVGQIIIPAHELFAQPKATQKLLDDAGIDVETWLAGKVSRKIGRVENSAFVVGDGSLKPKGFLDYAAWASAGTYERNAVEQINSGTSASFDGDSFKDLQNSLIEDYQTSAVWMMKRSTWSSVTQLKDSTGRYLFETFSNFRDGDQLMVLGKRVVLADDMPEQAADSLSVIFGDFNEGYMIADRIGIRILRDPFTSKPFIKFYTTKRTGGAVSNYEALKIMKLAA